METLVIQVDCRPTNPLDGNPQLGITVEAPYSQNRSNHGHQRKQQLASAKDYRDHDYQNFENLLNGAQLALKDQSQYRNHNGHNRHDLATANGKNQHTKPQINSPSTGIEGLQITQIQEGSVIDRNGRFRIGDIIVEVNGVSLQRPFGEAQKTLKQFVVGHSSHGPLRLKVIRRPTSSSSSMPSTTGSQSTVIERNNNVSATKLDPHASTKISPTTTTSPTSPTSSKTSASKMSRHLVGALNTRKIGVKHKITLKKGDGGSFGIKIAERDNMYGSNKPIFITAITTTGSAYRDGRLQEGDMLLAINGIDLSGKSQPEVTKILKDAGPNDPVEFLVSRHESSEPNLDDSDTAARSTTDHCDTNKSLIDLDVPEDDSVFIEKKIDNIINISNVDGPGEYVYDIPLNDTKSAGLGLYLKYPRRSQDCKDLGIWIQNVITGGAAWKDGRLLPDDQILAINGINLVGLSNADASETLTAAVCRGIGPEATPNIIKLHIQRRDPIVVAKILHGTNNRIEHSDILSGIEKSYSSADRNDHSKESYKTAFESTMQNLSLRSLNDVSNSSGSSNQNSHNDSAMSPQTQASNSLKLSNICNDKSEQTSSDKTNDTSSAISQITDFTNVPINDRETYVSDNQAAATLPKSLQFGEDSKKPVDQSSGTQSWDDESLDARTGEEHFQRDGFGRQSISEKRHAQLNAKNTDTYRRNQRLRDERARQRQIEEQLAMQHISDERRNNYYLPDENQRLASSYPSKEFTSIYEQRPQILQNLNIQHGELVQSFHREVPIDVHLPNPIDNYQMYSNNSHPTADLVINRSNSLESIRQHNLPRDNIIVPRAGTVRVARNRKVNESFRVAVDRSYEGSLNESSTRNQSEVSDCRQPMYGGKMASSIATSNASTSNDEKYLIKTNSRTNSTNHKKSSSLLTKFLKFGSMKRKKKNRDNQDLKLTEIKSPPKDNPSGNLDTARSQSSHSRTQSSQSHPNLGTHHHHNSQQKTEPIDGQVYNSHIMKHPVLHHHVKGAQTNGIDIQAHRASMPICQYQPVHNLNTHKQLYHNSMTHAKFASNLSNRQAVNILNHQQQYSHIPLHHHHHHPQGQPLVPSAAAHQQSLTHHQAPLDIQNHPFHYPSLQHRTHVNHQLGMANGCQPQMGAGNLLHWQSTPMPATNGLWVANSNVTENQPAIHQQNIYGTVPQHGAAGIQQRPSAIAPIHANHQIPYVQPMNVSGSNNHQGAHLTGHYAATQQLTHNQQPQHIYYYDF